MNLNDMKLVSVSLIVLPVAATERSYLKVNSGAEQQKQSFISLAF